MSVYVVNSQSVSRLAFDPALQDPLVQCFRMACSHGYTLTELQLPFGMFFDFLRDCRLLLGRDGLSGAGGTGAPSLVVKAVKNTPDVSSMRFLFHRSEVEQVFVVARGIPELPPETARRVLALAAWPNQSTTSLVPTCSSPHGTSHEHGVLGSTPSTSGRAVERATIILTQPEDESAPKDPVGDTTTGALDYVHFLGALLLIASHRLTVPDSGEALWEGYFDALHCAVVQLFCAAPGAPAGAALQSVRLSA
eukprot:RCo026936